MTRKKRSGKSRSEVRIGDVSGGIKGSIIAGRDIVVNLILNWRLKWVAGILLLVGGVYAVSTYAPGLYHWYANIATEDEVLVLLADFQDESANVTYDAAGSIEEALRTALTQNDLADVRLVRIERGFKRNELASVKALGKRYNATLFIWGYYDDGGMFPRFTVLQEERLEIVPEGPPDKLVNLARPPDDFTLYVNQDLPAQMTYFTLFAIGQILYLERSYAEALTLFEDAVKSAETIEIKAIQKSLAIIYSYKGYIYGVVHKDNQQAIHDLTKAIELDPDNAVAAYNNRGGVYYVSGDLAQAIRDLTKAIELDPNYTAAYNSRGNIYRDSGDLGQAIRDFNRAIELDPNYGHAYTNRGLTYAASGDLAQAIRDYNKAIELDSTDAAAYTNRGLAYAASGDLAQAIRDYNKAIELSPDFAGAYNNRGNAYSDSANLAQAIRDYSKAIELDRGLAAAYNNRGLAYAASGDLAQAIRDYNKGIELDPANANAYYGRGRAYHSSGDMIHAIYDYSKTIELDPNLVGAYYNRGRAHAASDNLAQAVLDFTKVIELDPNFADAYYNRGFAYFASFDFELAIRDLERYLELAPDASNREEVMNSIEVLKAWREP